MSGLLGIWNNANQKFLHDYEDWYNNEHLFERLSVSNINVARRFQGLKSNYNYFTSYEAKTYKTFFSEEYLKKLNKPTKKTKIVTSHPQIHGGMINLWICLLFGFVEYITDDTPL